MQRILNFHSEGSRYLRPTGRRGFWRTVNPEGSISFFLVNAMTRPFTLRSYECAYGAVLFCVALASLLLATQGWKSQTPNCDLISHADAAQHLLRNRQLPDRGCLNSLASYTPPGIAWLMLPGVFFFPHEPRLFEYIGTSALHIGTLIGIFLLAGPCFGARCALFSVSLYGLSELGLFYAGSLWPRGHPFFYVWMVFWVLRWVSSGRSVYLAPATVTWAIGMYQFMEIAPALLILPVMWLSTAHRYGTGHSSWEAWLGWPSGIRIFGLK
jgi:hypothetical protein